MWWQPITADDRLVYVSAVTWPAIPGPLHPPLYIYSVRLSFLLFGESVSSARLPGVLSGFITLFLIPAVVTLVLGQSEQANWTATLAVWLYALSPQAVQNMMFIDIDTAFLTVALLGLVWLWLEVEPRPPWQRIILLGLGFALTLWVKLLSPFLTMGAMCLFYLLQGKFLRFLETFIASVLGGVVFWITFQTNIASQYAFGYTGGYMSRLNIFDLGNLRYMATIFPQGAGVVTLWLSIPVVILIGMALANSVGRWLRRKVSVLDEFLLYGGGSVLAYTLVIYPAWGYPRYQAPFIPILIILAAVVLAPALAQMSWSAWKVLAGIAILCFVFNLRVVGDPLLSLYLLTFETTTGQVTARLQQGIVNAARAATLIPVALLIGFWLAPRLRIARSAMLLAVVGVLAFTSLASTTLVQVNARYSTRYRYGYNWDDMQQAAQRVREHVGPTGYIAAIDDFLFYTGLDGEGIYGLRARQNFMGKPSISLLELMHERRIDALVWTTKDVTRNPTAIQEIEPILKECYDRETYGVFIVYLRRPGATWP